jgi:membrane-associated HD superfamily phosphohydrolase
MRNKQRHGCLTAWLIYLIIANSLVSLGLLFSSESVTKNLSYITSENVYLTVVFIGIADTLFSFLLLRWIKIGFWGLLTTGILLCIVQLINSNSILNPIITIVCLLILYGLLQLKKNNVSGWDNLE